MLSENAFYGEAPPPRPILYLFVYLYVVEKGYALSSNREKEVFLSF